MTAVSKDIYFDVLDKIVNKYNNLVHRTINWNQLTLHLVLMVNAINEKDTKFTVGDHVRVSKYKNIFAKEYTKNWSEEVFVVSKIKNTVLWTYVISDLNGEPITGSFFEKELQKTNQKEYRIEKVIKRKGDKLYVKWEGHDNSFNSWIDKKDIV